MKPLLIILLVTALVPIALADHPAKSVTLTPRLGAEFSGVIVIEGTIVDDTDTRLRSHLGKKLIEVHRVGDLKLKERLVIELSVFAFTDIEIPDRGTPVRFRGYETGGFTGIPRDAFEDIPQVATTNHHFKSWFQVTKHLKQTPAEQAGADQPANAVESK